MRNSGHSSYFSRISTIRIYFAASARHGGWSEAIEFEVLFGRQTEHNSLIAGYFLSALPPSVGGLPRQPSRPELQSLAVVLVLASRLWFWRLL